MTVFSIIVAVGWAVIVALFALAWWFVRGADNVDSGATMSLIFLPLFALAAIWVVVSIVWIVTRFI